MLVVLRGGAALLCLLVLQVRAGEVNLLMNGDFEDPMDGNWYCGSGKCVAERTEDSFSGRYAAYVHTRLGKSDSISQDVHTVKKNSRYYVKAYIKMLNDAGQFYGLARVLVIVRGASNDRKQIGNLYSLRVGDGWTEVGGDFMTSSDTNYVTVQVFMAENNDLNYLVDSVSLVEIEHDPDWRDKADARIEEHRKGNLRINTNIQSSNPDDITIWVNQTSSSFPLGCTALRPNIAGTDPSSIKYQEYFYEMFNWATPTNDLKWRMMEAEQDVVDYTDSTTVIEALQSRGITNIRGHSIAWNKEDKLKTWMGTLNDVGLINQAVRNRINYAVPHFKGKVKHWDVNNEVLSGLWYERTTQNPYFTQGMFVEAKKLDPDVQLFLNDHGVLSGGVSVDAYVRQVGQFLSNGIPVDGMGIQSHVSSYDLDITKHRLDRLAKVGIPIWITEFTMDIHDMEARTQGVENLLHLYYSYPAIEGIIIWGFWDQTHDFAEKGGALLEGPDLVENQAGEAFRNLVKTKWRTNIAHQHPSSPFATKNFRVHHGSYDISVLKAGTVVYTTTAQVEKNQDVEIDITV